MNYVTQEAFNLNIFLDVYSSVHDTYEYVSRDCDYQSM